MIQKPKGTLDILENSRDYRELENAIYDICLRYNYKEIKTPIFENTELFTRGVGETSDIVSKEMYTFTDKGDRSMTLRPEGTAPVVRAFIENKLYANADLPIKLYYFGPMFRYERPQAGRLRQFNQFGIESMGSESPLVDIEIISLMLNVVSTFGLKNLKVKINTLGDDESRNNYRDALKAFFEPHLESLCPDCQTRFDKNPLRILDCKVDRHKDFFNEAPKMGDYLSATAKEHFNTVLKGLLLNEIEFELDEQLVRGLDYYTHTVFEIESTSTKGAQNVIAAGGRYNKLVEELGGPKTACMGAAMGIERFLIALESEGIKLTEEYPTDVYLMALGEEASLISTALAELIRSHGYICDLDYANRGLKAQFKRADRLNAKAIVIFGDQELQDGVFNVKINGVEHKVTNEDLISFLEKTIGGSY